tara:strand:+ start:700 stop:846 length:147 start_codon:yes stop_codon:yes gene_type:complete
MNDGSIEAPHQFERTALEIAELSPRFVHGLVSIVLDQLLDLSLSRGQG